MRTHLAMLSLHHQSCFWTGILASCQQTLHGVRDNPLLLLTEICTLGCTGPSSRPGVLGAAPGVLWKHGGQRVPRHEYTPGFGVLCQGGAVRPSIPTHHRWASAIFYQIQTLRFVPATFRLQDLMHPMLREPVQATQSGSIHAALRLDLSVAIVYT